MDIVDCRGLKCPLPILKLEKYLSGKSGPIKVKLLSDDEMAIIDITHFCNKGGYCCQTIDEGEYLVFLISGKA